MYFLRVSRSLVRLAAGKVASNWIVHEVPVSRF